MANDNGFDQLAKGGFNGGFWPDSPDPTGPNDEGFTQPPPTHFPNTHCIWGFNMLTQLPDVVERSYESPAASNVFAVVPSDAALLPTIVSQLYIGVTGDVKLETEELETITLKGLAAGTSHKFPFSIAKIFATGTTATNIVGIF
jgi:hypothetical protein